jgi:hypothetical protein
MTLLGTEVPVFVSPYSAEQGGNDFLGLRQVNVDFMDECLPGFNNVTSYVRPFSLISWIYWKFHDLAASAHIDEPDLKQQQVWQEKVEILFTWGHILNRMGGIPGTDSRPPRSGAVSLDFESWKRIPTSTSLMAAVQYGPAAKVSDGLGFIEPVPDARGMFRTTGFGIQLAEGLESSLIGTDTQKSLSSLVRATGTEKDANKLFPSWSIQTPSRKEKNAFQLAFFDKNASDPKEALGRRSSTLRLILSALDHASHPLTVDEVRSAMFHQLGRRKANGDGQDEVSWHKWIALQVRQAHRLAMEAILFWIEERLNHARDRETGSMIKRAMEVHALHPAILPPGPTVSDVRKRLFTSNPMPLDVLISSSQRNGDYSLFELMGRILATIGHTTEESLMHALRILFLCAEYTDALEAMETVNKLLRHGGSERISLAYWRDFLRRCATLSLDEFLQLVFEQHVISQHLSVAARRFDGGTQRLRITIEEEGLTPLTARPLPLRVTPDRLATALSLMSDCDLAKHTADWRYTAKH